MNRKPTRRITPTLLSKEPCKKSAPTFQPVPEASEAGAESPSPFNAFQAPPTTSKSPVGFEEERQRLR